MVKHPIPEVPKDSDGDGYTDDIDWNPDDGSEWEDSDGDGVGNNADKFPEDATRSADQDLDGWDDTVDESGFGDDYLSWGGDSDGDGLADAIDPDTVVIIPGDDNGDGNPVSEDLPKYTNDEGGINKLQEDLNAAFLNLVCGLSYERPDEGLENKTYSELLEDAQITAFGRTIALSVEGIQLQENTCPRDELPAHYLISAVQSFESIRIKLLNSGEYLQTESQLQKNLLIFGLAQSYNATAGIAMLLGNNKLIQALRYRFDSKSSPNTPQGLFNDSRLAYIRNLEENPLNSGNFSDIGRNNLLSGDKLPFVAFDDIDVSYTQSGNGSVSELPGNMLGTPVTPTLARYTDMVMRYAMSGLSQAKQLFYKGNVLDVDNNPKNNFPGVEDLDINHDGIRNSAGREVASVKAKEVGNQVYFQNIALMAGQEPESYNENLGYEVKRQLNDANQLYRDIKSGFNPQQLLGDFVPYQPVENFIDQAWSMTQVAIIAENKAQASKRDGEISASILRDELRSLKERYRDQIEILTGIPVSESDLESAVSRSNYVRAVRNQTDPMGEFGRQYADILLAIQSAEITNKSIRNISEQIDQIEKSTNRRTELILATGEALGAAAYAREKASCCSVSAGVNIVAGVPVPFSQVTVKLGATIQANLARKAERLQALQSAEIGEFESDVRIKNLLLDQEQLLLSFERDKLEIERQRVALDGLWTRLDQLIANHVRANRDLKGSYLDDPAYRLAATRDEEYAEQTFESAIEAAYQASKAIEYRWSEKYNNPVMDINGGLASPLSVVHDPFYRAESVFSAQFASGGVPSLQDYMGALRAWDVKMRQMRHPANQVASSRFSMRDDILGYGGLVKEVAINRFKEFISEHRVGGENKDNNDLLFEFSLDVVTERLFPSVPNLKIDSVELNLVSDPQRSIRGGNRTDAAIVDLIMEGRSYTRSFFASYPDQDDLISYKLQRGRTLDQSPFIASVSATVNGYAAPMPAPNSQLMNHSPAANKWILRIKSNRFNNRDLILENLEDIEVQINYSFGKPRAIVFPGGM